MTHNVSRAWGRFSCRILNSFKIRGMYVRAFDIAGGGGKPLRWRHGYGLKQPRGDDGGLWPCGRKKMKTRLDFARRRCRQTRLAKLLPYREA